LALSKTSAAQLSAEPEFFTDRCLGHRTAIALAEAGWRVHRSADHFPYDGQKTSDPEWIKYGVDQGWALLTQDLRIRYRADELASLQDSAGVMFALANGNLTIRERVDYFITNHAAIRSAAAGSGPALYKIYADRIAKIWP
jgi:hypothetical protein